MLALGHAVSGLRHLFFFAILGPQYFPVWLPCLSRLSLIVLCFSWGRKRSLPDDRTNARRMDGGWYYELDGLITIDVVQGWVEVLLPFRAR